VSYWQGLLLGIVQGLTEFLPISSSGHLVVAQAAIGLTTPGVVVEVVLHVATLLAVLVVYWKRIAQLTLGGIRGDRATWHDIGLLALASVPAGLAGFFLADVFERAFDSLFAVGCDFMLTGVILWSTRWVRPPASSRPSAWSAGGIGLAQALAILPGISRSGTTIAAGMWARIEPEKAAEFSFLLAIPAIAGAAVLQLSDLSTSAAGIGWGPLALSFLAALVAGVLAIRLLVMLLRKGSFHRFAPYCWGIGLVTIWWALIR
jgi:undecaprenyl-diphosphatase